VPVRIEGPLQNPQIRPQVGEMFADPDKAGQTVRQIGDALQKKFKGKPVGEAIGRILGGVRIGPGGDDAEAPAAPRPQRPRAQPSPEADQGQRTEPEDPHLQDILR
jgi:hypothetical protein